MTIARGGDAKHYIATEAAYGTPKSPAATDALKVRSPFMFSKNHNVIKNDEFQPGTLDPMVETATSWDVTFSGGVYLRGGASQGAAPDIDDLMLTGFTKDTIVASTVASDAAVNAFKLAADYLDAGDIGFIEVENVGGAVIERKHFIVVSKTAGAVVTIFPALDNIPTVGDHVKACINYKPTMSNSASVSIHRSDNLIGQFLTGGKLQKTTMRFVRGQIAEADFEGFGQLAGHSIITTIAEDLDDSETGVDVAAAGIDEGAILLCDSEEMLVTAVSATGKVLTVTRGHNSTTPAVHTTGAAIGPKAPAQTVTGAEIIGLDGGIFFNDLASAQAELKADECTIEIGNGAQPYTYFGDGGKAQNAHYSQDREITLTVVAHLNAQAAELVRQTMTEGTTKFFIQAGETTARSFAFYAPKVSWNPPEIEAPKDDLVRVTFTSRLVMGSAGEDSFIMGF